MTSSACTVASPLLPPPRWRCSARRRSRADQGSDVRAPGHARSAAASCMESGELEKATGYKINWRMFGGGGDVIRAMASGDVQIGEVGSSPARGGGQPGPGHQAVLDPRRHRRRRGAGRAQRLRHQLGLKDLKGKKVATPFVSTAHYQLMAALEDGRRQRRRACKC